MRFTTRAWVGGLLAAAIAALTVGVVHGQKERKDPQPAFYFEVTIDGQQTGFFRSVSGLATETEVIEFREGGNNDFIHKLPGVTRHANIRLTRGFTGDRSLFDWVASVNKTQPVKVNGRIIMFDRHGTRVAAWTFSDGFPVKWEGPDFDASKNEIAIETIEIAHEGLKMSDDEEPPPSQ